MKTSKVYPLHKKEAEDDHKNYRPISLVTTFSKVLEKYVLHGLRTDFHENNLNLSKQHSFIPGRTTETALGKIIEHIIDNLDRGNTVISTSLDKSKAFECFQH